jgi:hypothetical protein
MSFKISPDTTIASLISSEIGDNSATPIYNANKLQNTAISELQTILAHNDVLVWDALNSEWIARPMSGTGSSAYGSTGTIQISNGSGGFTGSNSFKYINLYDGTYPGLTGYYGGSIKIGDTYAFKSVYNNTNIGIGNVGYTGDLASFTGLPLVYPTDVVWIGNGVNSYNLNLISTPSSTVFIGKEAGYSCAHPGAVYIGHLAGSDGNGFPGYGVAVGFEAGKMGSPGIAIGKQACYYGSQTSFGELEKTGIAIGIKAGYSGQNGASIAIGTNAASQTRQGEDSIAIGFYSGANIKDKSIAIGSYSDFYGVSSNTISIGNYAGYTGTSVKDGSISIGNNSGYVNQKRFSIALGSGAGRTEQGQECVAIGLDCARLNQGDYGIAIGTSAGVFTQGSSAIAIGNTAGYTAQGPSSISIGDFAGYEDQNAFSISIGKNAGRIGQGSNAIAIGTNAGYTGQGPSSIIIGTQTAAGNEYVGSDSVAIGKFTTVDSNCVSLNASSVPISCTGHGFFVNPIRPVTSSGFPALAYDTSTNELVHDSAKPFVIDHPIHTNKFLVHACLEGPESGVYYRGKSVIDDCGFIVVELPEYACAIATNFTISLTPIMCQTVIYTEDDVRDNKFKVYGKPGTAFHWVVYGERIKINCELSKSEYERKGDGPYTYLIKNKQL